MRATSRSAASALFAAVPLALTHQTAGARTAPPSPAALIAAAKATPLAKFQVKDEIKDLTVEA